jgi:hypothetical protein
MLRPVHGLALLLPLFALGPARASFDLLRFSQIASGNDHYVLLPAGSQGTDESLVGRYWQVGAIAVNNRDCDETNWLYRCETDCPPAGEGTAFYVDGVPQVMPCTTESPHGEMVLLLEDLAYYGEFFAARVDESPSLLFDFSRLGVDLRPVPIPSPTVQSISAGTATVSIPDPASGFYGLPGVPVTGTITGFRVLTIRSFAPPTSRSAWTQVARFPYSGGVTTGSAFVGEPCPSNDPRSLNVAVALEFEGSVLTNYVSPPRLARNCIPERVYGGGHAAETGSGALQLSRATVGELTLSWGPPCVTPNEFAVYEGVLGDWTSHVPRSCRATSPSTMSEPDGNAYYLVVPEMYNLNPPDLEGSYGLLRDGSERPRGAQTCVEGQGIVACP